MASSNRTNPKVNKNKYENPWNKWPFGTFDGPYLFCKWILTFLRMPKCNNLEDNLPIMEPYFIKDFEGDLNECNKIRATWLGHASVLVEIDGFRVLCDPIFSERCPRIVGPRRFRKAPCDVDDLPRLDAVLISHNHYDHMDSATVASISEKYPLVHWLIPKNDGKNLRAMLVQPSDNIHEMSWWDHYDLCRSQSGQPDSRMTIYFTPTQHWSNRGIRDTFKSLWGSWALIGPSHRFWFGGDTGYCGAFKEIGENFGPFDGAAIPIGAYHPRELVKYQHVDPAEALDIHNDIKSKVSFGIHWGTFQLTSEHYMEPKEKIESLANSRGNINFLTLNHGETLEIIRDTFRKLPCEKKVFVEQSWLSSSLHFLSSVFSDPFCRVLSKFGYCQRKSRSYQEIPKDEKQC